MERLTARIAASVEIAARRALAVRELLAGADRAEGDVVRDDHADRRLDLLGGRAHHRAEVAADAIAPWTTWSIL
jgi:hypothetical protein